MLGKVWKPKQNLSPEAASAPFPPVWCFQGTLAGNHQSAPWCITAAVNLDVDGLPAHGQLQDIPNPKVPPKSWGLRLQPRLGADNLMNLRRIAEGARVCVARNHMGWACWAVSDCFLMFLTPGFCPEYRQVKDWAPTK